MGWFFQILALGPKNDGFFAPVFLRGIYIYIHNSKPCFKKTSPPKIGVVEGKGMIFDIFVWSKVVQKFFPQVQTWEELATTAEHFETSKF